MKKVSEKRNIVGVKELRENLDHYIDKVSKGASFTVVRRSKAVFTIVPLDEEEQWETVFDATRDNKGKGIPAEDILKALKNIDR